MYSALLSTKMTRNIPVSNGGQKGAAHPTQAVRVRCDVIDNPTRRRRRVDSALLSTKMTRNIPVSNGGQESVAHPTEAVRSRL